MSTNTSTYPEQDIFLWLERPLMAEIRAVLSWAHTRALRKDIRCGNNAMTESRNSDTDFKNIVAAIDRDSKDLFRIIVRKGFNRLMLWDSENEADILDIGIRSVKVGNEFYSVNLYLSATLLGQLKREFALAKSVCPQK